MSEAPDEATMTRRARRGTAYLVLGFGGSQVLRLVANLIVTRLLPPGAFGLMKLVNVVLRGIFLFSDIGISASLIQNKRRDVKFLGTVYTLMAGRGVILTLAAAIAAAPMAAGYDAPMLLYLIPFCGLAGVIGGLQSPRWFHLGRDLRIETQTAIMLASAIAGSAVMLVWAFVRPSVWALAAGGIVTATVRTVLTHLVIPGERVRFMWERKAAGAVLTFGKWIFLSTLLGFVARESDSLVFGKLVPIDMLGIYAIASLIAEAPQLLFRRMAQSVHFPRLAQAFRSEVELGPVHRRERRRILVLAGWVLAGFIAGGPTIIDLLYEDTYQPAGPMLQLLAAAGWFATIHATISAALLARGESARVAASNGAKVVAMAVLMPVGYVLYDFHGAIAGFALAETFAYAAISWLSRPAKLGALRQELGHTAVVAAAAAAAFVAVLGVQTLGRHVVFEAVVVFGVVSAVWSPWLVPVIRANLRRRAQPSPPSPRSPDRGP